MIRLVSEPTCADASYTCRRAAPFNETQETGRDLFHDLRPGRFGMTQELINGRAALLGFVAAIAADQNAGYNLLDQVCRLKVITRVTTNMWRSCKTAHAGKFRRLCDTEPNIMQSPMFATVRSLTRRPALDYECLMRKTSTPEADEGLVS